MKTRNNKKEKEAVNELCLFSDMDMLGGRIIRQRKNDDLEQFTDAVVDALKILEKLDKSSIDRIAEECYYNSLDSETFVKSVIYLHSLPGYFFNNIQYLALEYCVQQVGKPFYRWSTVMPEGCYERGLCLFRQQRNNTKRE